MDSHAPVTREAIDGNARHGTPAPTASIAALALMVSKRFYRDTMQPNASFQNLLHRAC